MLEINPTFSFTLLGTFVIYLWTRPSRSGWLAVLIIAVGLRWLCTALTGGFGLYYGVWWISWGAFIGIASLIVLAVKVVRLRDPERKSCRETFYAGAVFPLSSLLIGYTLSMTTWLRPKTYDAFLLAFDGSLGFQPSFALGRLLRWGSNAWGLTTVIYYALPLAGITAYAAHRTKRNQPVAILPLLLSLIVIGFAQYSVYPAVGPRYAYAAVYPQSQPDLARVNLQPMAVPTRPRNCMPSLHLAAALVLWWNSRIWPNWARSLAGLFVLATVFSTLALGEHYLADLVVAFPFTLAFQAAWTTAIPAPQSARRRPFCAGVILTVGWLVLLRYGLSLFLASPVASWTALIFTVAWCTKLESNLAAVSRLRTTS